MLMSLYRPARVKIAVVQDTGSAKSLSELLPLQSKDNHTPAELTSWVVSQRSILQGSEVGDQVKTMKTLESSKLKARPWP